MAPPKGVITQKKKPRPPARVKGVSSPANDAIKALQAESMFKMRVEGHTMEEIASRHNMAVATAYRRMSWAEEQGIIYELQERVRRDLAPKALSAYEKVLDRTSPFSAEELETEKVKLTAAKDIAFGSGILTKDTQKARADVEMHSLDWYYTHSKAAPTGHSEVVDAEPHALLVGETNEGAERTETAD